MMKKKEISRRDFLKGTGAGAASLALAGVLTACSSSSSEAEETEDVEEEEVEETVEEEPAEETADETATGSYTYADTIAWDAEYDVVVLGMGASGCVAAKTAADEGAAVLIAEKMEEAHAGGNSKVCGQLFAYGYGDVDNTLTYYKALAGSRDIEDAMLETIADGVANMAQTLEDEFEFDSSEFFDWTGVTLIGEMSPEYPELPGSDKIGLWTTHAGVSDSYLYTSLKQLVLNRSDSIDVWYASPAQSLIQDPVSGAIIGVKIERGGEVRNVRALNGVCVCTGGFEDDPEMVQHYLNVINYAPLGGLYNTGDGIKMCMDVGAQLWHMSVYEGGFGLGGTSFVVDEGTNATGIQTLSQGVMNTGALVLVGTDGERFLNESEIVRHGHLYDNGLWENPRFPEKMFVIFDQTQYDLIQEEGSIPEAYQEDIMAFDTIEEMAEGTGCDVDKLTDTIESFNFFAQQGKDYAHGRDAEFLREFDGEKYYAVPLISSILNTQGGPKRNENAEVLDLEGNPIPHLYSAGEMGGITVEMYQGGTNIAECITFGRIAGRNAAAAKEDLPEYENAVPVTSSPTRIGEDTDVGAESTTAYETGDNEYIGTGTGMNGDVTVKVTVEDGTITAVEVLEQEETEGIGSLAIEQLPEQFVGLSSEEEIDALDGVSSATITSNALKEAVKAALAQAQ